MTLDGRGLSSPFHSIQFAHRIKKNLSYWHKRLETPLACAPCAALGWSGQHQTDMEETLNDHYLIFSTCTLCQLCDTSQAVLLRKEWSWWLGEVTRRWARLHKGLR